MYKGVCSVQACEVVSACFEEAAQGAGVGGAPNLPVHKVQSPLFNTPDALPLSTSRNGSRIFQIGLQEYTMSH